MKPVEISKKKNLVPSFAEQFPRNLGANIAYFLVNIIIGLVLVPYFISTLGVAAYGLIPLVTSITGYVNIFNLSLNTTISRYLTVELQQEDFESANKTFNTSVIFISFLIALMIPVIFFVAYNIPKIFNVPRGLEIDSILLFLGVCFAFIIRSWSGNFTVQLFAYNRLDLQNIVSIFNLIVQTALIVFFFVFFGPNLALVGLAYLIGAIVASILSILLARHICPYLSISCNSLEISRIRKFTSMGWWVLINNVGSILFLQIDIILVNILFGDSSAGEYSIVLMWVILLRGVAAVLAGVLTPMVLTFYAKKHFEKLLTVTKSSVKLMGLAMALPIGLVCGFSKQILIIWVGPEFLFLIPLLILMNIHLVVNLAVLPLFSINVAYNKVKIPGIITLIMSILNIVLAVILSLFSELGYYGVAIAGAIVLTFKNSFFTPWYATKILGINPNIFAKVILQGIFVFVFIVFLAVIIGILLPITSLLLLIIECSLILVLYLIIVWKFGLNQFEKDLFMSYLPAKTRSLFS